MIFFDLYDFDVNILYNLINKIEMKIIGDASKIIITYSILSEEKIIYSNKNEIINLKEKNSFNYILKTILKDKEEKYSGTFFIKEKNKKEDLLTLKIDEYPGIKFKKETIIRLGVDRKIYGYVKDITEEEITIDIEEPFLKKNIEVKINVLKIIEE